MYIVKTNNLTKKYNREYANKDISICINKGDIYGLIGKNGAGKTTLMKQIAGMIYSSSGNLEWNDKIPKIGLSLGPSDFEGDFDAITLLELYGRYIGNFEKKEILELLELVGLDNVGRKKVRKFSTGMKQRLSIAIALLGNPEFVILDEPINGLDPVGVKKIREAIVKINLERHTTFLISSHMLGELLKVANRYCVLAAGKVVKELDALELDGKTEEEKELYFIRIMEGFEK